MVALLPPNSRILLPNLEATATATDRPTAVEPVKLTKATLLSFTSVSPKSLPPTEQVKTPKALCLARISLMILVQAMVTKGTLGAPFQCTVFPVTRAKAKFQPKTAQGKLKAVMTPMIPIGFQTSYMLCSGLSLGITFPAMLLDKPQA